MGHYKRAGFKHLYQLNSIYTFDQNKITMPSTQSTGYDPSFLGQNLTLPKPIATLKKKLAPLKNSTKKELTYTHFSCFVHKERKLPLFTAVNIRGAQHNGESRAETDDWNHDSRMLEEYQIGEELYGNDENTFDRGHMVRRIDPTWGNLTTARKADKDTFHYTNCAPQHKNLNRKIWQELERHILENGSENGKVDISVFSGPVLSDDDLPFKNLIEGEEVKIPVVYWKVIVWKKESDNKLYAVGFMQSQWQWIKTKVKRPRAAVSLTRGAYTEDFFEHLEFKNDKTYQVSISEIEKATGLNFAWKNVKFPYKEESLRAISGRTVQPRSALTGTRGFVEETPNPQTKLMNIVL
jgi:endonuclease G